MDSIRALSVLDGRYCGLVEDLGEIFSEYGLIKHRVHVEVKWLCFLVKNLKIAKLDESGIKKIQSIASSFDIKSAERVKKIEKTTNHDMKAVEYYVKEELERAELGKVKEWVHFACTSEDINNTSYALMLKYGRTLVSDIINQLLGMITEYAGRYKSVAMISRTHGQPASPTTLGKEFVNFAWRIKEELSCFEGIKLQAKMNGATGNFNAHSFAFPEIDWIKASTEFISNYLEIEPLLYTTQINPYSYISKLMHSMVRTASIIIDLDRDMWGYISLGYFKQQLKKGEVGSSTMPHKVNPIDFENSEGNMGIAISMMQHLGVKLLNSRFQRDLTDSTVLRNIGSALGYFTIGLKNAIKGLGKLELDQTRIQKDIDNNPELLAEPIQTLMRVFGEENPYEKLKELTRGRKITKAGLESFIDNLESVPDVHKERMKQLSVGKYIGLAETLTDQYINGE